MVGRQGSPPRKLRNKTSEMSPANDVARVSYLSKGQRPKIDFSKQARTFRQHGQNCHLSPLHAKVQAVVLKGRP